MKILTCSVLALAALLAASCSHSETDGRQYHGNISPIQGKMGVTFKRVPADASAVTTTDAAGADTTQATATTTAASSPPGLLDPYIKTPVDEPGAEYWMHGRQSPDPIQSKMGVRVRRVKKS